jgi:general secretion pathway protein M
MAFRALDRLNARERRLVNALGVFLGVAVVLAVPIGLTSVVHGREAENQELATALSTVQEARGQVRDRKEKKEQLLQRYSKKAPALAGFLEQAAQHEKLELMDTDKRPDLPHGKRYVERSTAVHLKKAGLVPITKFLEAIEKSGYPVELSHLTMRKRLGEQDSYDVQVGVSAFDRNDVAAAPTAAASPATQEKQP